MGDCSIHPTRVEAQAGLALLSANELLGQLLRHFLDHGSTPALRMSPGVDHGDSALWLVDVQSFDELELARLFADLYDRGPVALVNVSLEQAEALVEQYPWINGVFFAGCPREQFLLGLDVLLRGGDWLPRGLMEQLLRQLRRLRRPSEVKVRLTAREREILELVRKGLPNAEIADRLCLSPHTIKSHVHNLLRKVGAANRAEAAFLVLGG